MSNKLTAIISPSFKVAEHEVRENNLDPEVTITGKDTLGKGERAPTHSGDTL